MSVNNDKRIQSIESIETYAYGTNEEMVQRKEEIKCNYTVKQHERWLTMTMLAAKGNINKQT